MNINIVINDVPVEYTLGIMKLNKQASKHNHCICNNASLSYIDEKAQLLLLAGK